MIPVVCLMLAASLDPTVDSAAIPRDLQWAVIAACPRVGGGPDGGSVATAVCIGCRDGFAYLLTSAHVVPKGDARAYEFFSRESYPGPARSLTRGEVVVRLADADVALVKLPIGATLVPSLRLANPGERPKRFPVSALAVGCPTASAPVCRIEKLVDKTFVRRPEGGVAFFWQSATVPVGGMSGGPLIDASGRVIGICSAAQGGRGYFSHLDEIQYGLKQHGYGWLFAP